VIPHRLGSRSRQSVLLVSAVLVSACGAARQASPAEQRDVSRTFAAALLTGRVAGAQALVATGVDAAVHTQVATLGAPFVRHRGRFAGRARRSGSSQWTFPYRRRVNGRNGAFSRESGWILVDTTTGVPPRVRFVAVLGRQVVESTHHDAVLLPSKR
jgi:hypothetical protein